MSSSCPDSKPLIPFIQLKSWSICSKVWLLTSNIWKSLYQFQFPSNSGICYKLHKMTTTAFLHFQLRHPAICSSSPGWGENINFIWRQVHSPKELHYFAYNCQLLSNIDYTYFNLLGPHTKGLQMELSFKDQHTTSPAKGSIEQQTSSGKGKSEKSSPGQIGWWSDPEQKLELFPRTRTCLLLFFLPEQAF